MNTKHLCASALLAFGALVSAAFAGSSDWYASDGESLGDASVVRYDVASGKFEVKHAKGTAFVPWDEMPLEVRKQYIAYPSGGPSSPDIDSGFAEGSRQGVKAQRSGFERPTGIYLDKQLATLAPPRSALWKSNFKIGYYESYDSARQLYWQEQAGIREADQRRAAEGARDAADQSAGYLEGHRIGKRRRVEGFQTADSAYLKKLMQAFESIKSEAWRASFIAGYKDAFK